MEGQEVQEQQIQQQQIEEPQMQNGDQFDFESIVLRRADPDDCDAILNLVEIGEDDIFNRVYSYPKILKLIETAYMAITVLDRNGNVVAFAAFEDHPPGLMGMNDDKHFNYWEDWFSKAYKIEEFSAFNTLWLNYFICGAILGQNNQQHAFKQVLQTVYTSIPDLVGVLFLARGDAEQDDMIHCFGPLQHFFARLELHDSYLMQSVRGIPRDSQVFFTPRLNVLPYIEIREAKQEDHDDLADVFNSQSETITEAYGEYFIAELIAAQNETNKALVAQVKDKAVGLMGLTKEVDLKLLHQCFELDPFDNLLKGEYMDAIRTRRDFLRAKAQRHEDNIKIEAQMRRNMETLKCHRIAQRMALQEHLLGREAEIAKEIEDLVNNEEEYKKLNREEAVKTYFLHWLNDFVIHNPGEFFEQEGITDDDLECNIQEPLDFLMQTLEIFGLPAGYLSGGGHHADWDQRRKEAATGRGKKKAKQANKQAKLTKAQKLAAQIKEKKDQAEKPTHFDLGPFQKALKNFLAISCQARSNLRTQFVNNADLVRNVFQDTQGEQSFNRCIDIKELAGKLTQNGYAMDATTSENLGATLICFGLIELTEAWGERVPPETDEQRKAKMLLELRRSEREKAKAADNKGEKKLTKQLTVEELQKKQREEEDEKRKDDELMKQMKPSAPIKVLLDLTSIHDLINALDRMSTFDRHLADLSPESEIDFSEENGALANANRPYKRQFQLLPELQEPEQYCQDAQINAICEQINDLETIPDPPESVKNAFAITLFCMEAAVDSRSKDFLKYAFELYPERDYLIVTQPHTVPENALLSKFTLVKKKLSNTFSHVLYLIHRDFLLEQNISMTRTEKSDFEGISELLYSMPPSDTTGTSNESSEQILANIRDATERHDSAWLSYSARVEDSIVATFIISKDVNLEYYKSHFHVQDQILMAEHERKGHARLIYSLINPIFEKSTRFMLKELLRLSGKTCLYFEIQSRTVIPTIFSELVHIRSRRFPHLLDRKWDHERFEPEKGDEEAVQSHIPMDGKDRDPLDEEEPPFALCFSTKRLLSEPKIIKNSRIVVVGASDTGISFVEALLSISYLQFSNITLISPGGLPHHHVPDKKGNLKAYSTSYTFEELKKLMLESRLQVIDSRMTDIDRSDKNVILHDRRVIPYDTLILTMGIQDQTLSNLKYTSMGIAIDPIKNEGKRALKRANGVLSVDDPKLYHYLAPENQLMQALTDRRRTTNCVVYGRTLHSYALIQGLLDRGVRPKSIIVCVPEPENHIEEYDDSDPIMQEDLPVIYPNAFEDENIEQKIQTSLEEKGIVIYKQVQLKQIITDKDRLGGADGGKNSQNAAGTALPSSGGGAESDEENGAGFETAAANGQQQQMSGSGNENDANLAKLVFRKLNESPGEEEEEEDEDDYNMSNAGGDSEMGGMSGNGDEEEEEKSKEGGEGGEEQQKKKRRKRNELEIEARVLVTCGHRDVDNDVFRSIHDNGLVYNGRLIVDKNFQTTDPSVFAAGSLCEFSNRYKALSQGRSLRMDRYNGREMGSRLARSVFDIHDPHNPSNNVEQDYNEEELPLFFLPQGQGGVLPNSIIYYNIRTTNPLILKPGEQEVKNRSDLVCDNLDTLTGQGHFIKFTFNSIGLIDSVTYMGHEEVILQSLWSFVGLHENYLNELTSRYEGNIIPNAVQFLSENWAIALYHEWFGDFCLRMRQGLQGLADVQAIIGVAFDKTQRERKGLSREQMKQLSQMLDGRTVKMIQEETLEFIKTNMNHLPMYYIPGKEFA